MTFDANKPALTDDIATALATYVERSLEHLKDAINQEHGWNDGDATASVHDQGSARIYVQTSAPSVTSTGRLWYDSDDKKLYYNNAGSWVEVDLTGSLLALAGGTMAGNIAMGSNKITGLAAGGTGTNDACTVSQAESLVGAGGAHASSHTNGVDDVQSATDSVKGVMTAADHTKLSNLVTSGTYRRIVWATDHDKTATLSVGSATGYVPAIVFADSGDPYIYFFPIRIPNGYTKAYFGFRYKKPNANAGNCAFIWGPVVNGAGQSEQSVTVTMAASTDEGSYGGLGCGLTGLTAGNWISGYIQRDVSDSYASEIYVTAGWFLFAA